jgi:hypothetical protein
VLTGSSAVKTAIFSKAQGSKSWEAWRLGVDRKLGDVYEIMTFNKK